jgi:hypothetical protein
MVSKVKLDSVLNIERRAKKKDMSLQEVSATKHPLDTEYDSTTLARTILKETSQPMRNEKGPHNLYHCEYPSPEENNI